MQNLISAPEKILLIILVGLLFSFATNAQGYSKYRVPYLNAAPAFESPEKELELLPDTPSYQIIEEIYNADTLTYQGARLLFHNSKDDRYAIITTSESSTSIVRFHKISDTFSIQTKVRLQGVSIDYDSTLVWWENGRISRASVKSYGTWQDHFFAYENGKLIHETVVYPESDKRETSYIYEGDRLTKIKYIETGSSTETNILYTDSLITTTIIENTDTSKYIIKALTHLDDRGRTISFKTYMKRPRESELHLYQSEEYIYFDNGVYQKTATLYNPDQAWVSKMEFHPGLHSVEKWTWPGDDQVWILRSY